MTAVLADYLQVPRNRVEAHWLSAFTYDLVDPYTKLPYRVETFEEGLDHYRFPRGNQAKLQRVFGGLERQDLRTVAPLTIPLKFTGKLYDEQKKLLRDWLQHGYGVIQSPPRSGKTVIMTALMCKLRQRTLMLAHLEDLCDQLEETIRAFTNIAELEDRFEQQLVGVLEEWDDFFPVATLSTYQCFAVSPKGRRVLAQHRDDFGLVMVDEVHRCFAPGTIVSGRAIETLQKGDTVQAYDGQNIVDATVQAVMTSTVKKLLTIECESGRILAVTPNHPLWDGVRYRRADSFEPGEPLFLGAAGARQEEGRVLAVDRVASVAVHEQGSDGGFEYLCPEGLVYNLTVEPHNNYFADGILVHNCKTDLYREVVEGTTAAYRCGVTATPTRKDGLHCVVYDTLGPVVTVGHGEQLSVQYSWEYTGVEVPEFHNWSVLWNRLVKRKRRTQTIAKKVVQDVQDGHYVLVTTERLQHLDDLQFAIQSIDPDITVGLLSSKTKDREGFRNAAKRGEYQVVVAMNKIVELGYNIPRWSCFHNTLPMTNKENWYQRISRIRTPMEPAFKGDDWQKPPPIARIWIDNNHPAVFAYKAIVQRENDRLGFRCLNPDIVRRTGKRKGMGFGKEE